MSGKRLGLRLVIVAIVVAGALYLAERRRAHRAEARIEVVAGAEARRVSAIELELRAVGDTELTGTYRGAIAAPQPGGVLARWPLAVPAGRYDLAIHLTADGRSRTLTRAVDITDTRVVRVDLAAALGEDQSSR